MRGRFAVLLALTLVSLAGATGASASTPTFVPYTVTDGKSPVSGGEPSIGVNPKTNAVIFGADGHETRMVFDDATNPATAKQTDVTAPTAVTTLDAITFVDQQTGRLFDSQLLGVCSGMSYSDDDGATWQPTSGCGQGTLLDHQSVGGGPFHAPFTGTDPIYPDAVYYCAQNGFNATCAVSLDGGLTFGPGVHISNTPANSPGDPFGGACSGLHGHLRVGPDGTAYVPIKGCGGTPTADNLTNQEFFGGKPAVSVSNDNGTTWTVHTVPGGHNGDESDNAVATDAGNRLYMAWQDASYPDPANDAVLPTTSQPKVAYSTDEGTTWSKPFNLADALPKGSGAINNVQFPEVIAGSAGRAAVAFLGTSAVGDDQHNSTFMKAGPGGTPPVWHLYIAMTYDGGNTWTTVDTTPNDPVQRGCVDLQGTSNKTVTDNDICSQRNLLDFNDISVDRDGRVVAAYADGCVDACVTNPDPKTTYKTSRDMVMRQATGPGLYASHTLPSTPEDATAPTGSSPTTSSSGTPPSSPTHKPAKKKHHAKKKHKHKHKKHRKHKKHKKHRKHRVDHDKP
jgi:hypothetical protein